MAEAGRTRQVRRWGPAMPVMRRSAWVGLAAAGLLIAGLVVALGGGGRETEPAPTPSPSAPAVVVPSASPSPFGSPSATPTVACPTETSSVLTGAAVPPTSTAPGSVPDDILRIGAYVTQRDGEQVVNVWSIRGGEATRIAAVVGPDFNDVSITDISPDGTQALIELGEIHGGSPRPWCHDLYLVQTDGSGARRLTFNVAEGQAYDGRFSLDGRLVAYVTETPELPGSPQVPASLAIIDLTGAGAPITTNCVTGSQAAFAWGPMDGRLVAACTDGIAMFANGARTETVELPYGDELPLLLAWPDPDHVLLATVVGGATMNTPIQTRTIAVNPGSPGNAF